MKSNKYKSTLKHLIIPIIMILLIIAVAPQSVYAAGGSMTDEDGAGSANIKGGPNYDRTGYLFWVCDSKGNKLSTVQAITSYGGIVDRNGRALPSSNIDLRNRDGAQAVVLKTNAPWGPPYKDGQGRGTEIKQWLLQIGASGHKRAASIIKENWGEELAIKWEQQEAYLVFEPFYWHQVRANGVGTGIWYCTTSYRWGILQGAWTGIPDTGDRGIRKYTNQMYPNCVKMEDCQEIRDMGYTAPPHGGLLTNSEMASTNIGWGIGVVWNDDDSIHSYWAPNGSPGLPEPADPPKNGACNIVKSYYEEDLNTGSKVDLGTFYTANCTNSIIIDDEPKFEMVGWKISSTNNFGINSLHWAPPSTVTRTGTSATAVKLINAEKTVYILLV